MPAPVFASPPSTAHVGDRDARPNKGQLPVPLAKGRRLMLVADLSGALAQHECVIFLRDRDGAADGGGATPPVAGERTGRVIALRNPSYFVDDVRVLGIGGVDILASHAHGFQRGRISSLRRLKKGLRRQRLALERLLGKQDGNLDKNLAAGICHVVICLVFMSLLLGDVDRSLAIVILFIQSRRIDIAEKLHDFQLAH